MTELLYNKILDRLKCGNLIIFISGASCSGKSTLAEQISDKFKDLKPLIICEDDWYKNINDIKRNNDGYLDMESINSFEIKEFKNDIYRLLTDGYCFKPKYDIASNTRISKDINLLTSRLIIIEGLHTIDIFSDFDTKYNTLYILLNTDLNLCEKRRADRDSKLFNISEEMVINHYRNVIYKNYRQYLLNQTEIVKSKETGIILN